MADDDDAGDKKLPTIREALSDYFGIQLPGLPAMPQTVKNADKAIGQVVLALGGNLSERIKISTGKLKASGRIEIEDLVRNTEERRKLTNRATIPILPPRGTSGRGGVRRQLVAALSGSRCVGHPCPRFLSVQIPGVVFIPLGCENAHFVFGAHVNFTDAKVAAIRSCTLKSGVGHAFVEMNGWVADNRWDEPVRIDDVGCAQP